MRCIRPLSITLSTLWAALGAVPALALTITGGATLSGDQEVPPVATTASGIVSFTLDDQTGLMDVTATIEGISLADITFPAAPLAFGALGPFHIHAAPAGVNGSIITPFPLASYFSDTATGLEISASGIAFDLDFLDELLAGDMYFNLHTLTNGGGEIRGQISAVPEPASAALLALGLTGLVAEQHRARRSRSTD
jgi:CHRD domain